MFIKTKVLKLWINLLFKENKMNELLQMLMSNPNMLGKMSEKTGLDASSIGAVIGKLAPELMKKAKENLDSDSDSSNLLDMISKSNVDNESVIDDENIGNAMLGELTGSKESSKSLASNIGESLGIDSSSISKLLPMVAPLVMGMLNKKTGGNVNDTNSLTSMITGFIDQDGDGSVVDDLMGMAKKFF